MSRRKQPSPRVGITGPVSSSSHVSGFSKQQLERLKLPIDKDHVHVRELGGRQLSYVEGWYAVAQANEIFGYSGWDRETVHFERVYEKTTSETATCGYLARVRIKVRAGDKIISREGSGWGWAQERNVGAAYEKALKSAETDATKRALSTFGAQFGLTLYDKEQNGAGDRRKSNVTLFAPDGQPLSDNLSSEAYCSGLRQLIHACRTIRELDDLTRCNATSLTNLRSVSPFLRNADGVHFADLLLRLMGRARRRLSGPIAGAVDMAGVAEANPIQGGAEIRKFPVREGEFKKAPMRPAVPSTLESNARLNEAPANSGHSHGRHGGLNGPSAKSGHLNGHKSDQKGVPTDSGQPTGAFSFGVQFIKDEKTGGLAVAPVFAGEVLPAIPLQVEKGSQEAVKEASHQSVPLTPSKIAPGPRIDKSVLVIGSERRIRDKVYLKQIHDQPCTICGRQPSHAHHLRFAQKHGLSQKVSDEYVVPLCGLHHGDLHRSSDEPSWWKRQKIDPLPIAAELWGKYRGKPA